ncbi:MAG TPA: chemotaxis protein CheC [Longimicrobiales bacterium]|nr:chemotaxis protein CheC [Longimicrobiales bacterium]
MDPRDLGPRQLDGLREIANIGAGHAATALSQLVNDRVMVEVPDIRVVRLEDVPELLGAPDEIVSAIMMKLLGDVTGRTIQVFPGFTAAALVGALTGRSAIMFPDDFGEMEQSALKEASNILVGAYINALSDFMGMMLIMSAPALAIDTAAAVLATSYLNFGDDNDFVFFINTHLALGDDVNFRAHFLLLPDDASLKAMLRAMRLS